MIDNMTIQQIENKTVQFFHVFKDGLIIGLDENGFQVKDYTILQAISSGGTKKSFSPLEAIKTNYSDNKVLKEFENLLNNNATESMLEDFLKTYYRILFPLYDSITTQLWLRFPEIDIAEKIVG